MHGSTVDDYVISLYESSKYMEYIIYLDTKKCSSKINVFSLSICYDFMTCNWKTNPLNLYLQVLYYYYYSVHFVLKVCCVLNAVICSLYKLASNWSKITAKKTHDIPIDERENFAITFPEMALSLQQGYRLQFPTKVVNCNCLLLLSSTCCHFLSQTPHCNARETSSESAQIMPTVLCFLKGEWGGVFQTLLLRKLVWQKSRRCSRAAELVSDQFLIQETSD